VRVLVLGSGGVTGAAWQLGVIEGLRASGAGWSFDGAAPGLVVGTSAGAWLGALLLDGQSPAAIADAFAGLPAAPALRPAALARLLAAQAAPDRTRAVARLGEWSRRRGTAAATAWQTTLAAPLLGRDWPAALLVVTCDARTGAPVLLRATSGLPLHLAVAASCALPGVLPPVRVGERLLFDGGLRSPANLDLAGGGDSFQLAGGPDSLVLALAPLTGSLRPSRRPRVQARRLTAPSRATAAHPAPRVVLIEPDLAARRAIGVDVMSAARWRTAFAAGVRQGARAAANLAAEDHPGS